MWSLEMEKAISDRQFDSSPVSRRTVIKGLAGALFIPSLYHSAADKNNVIVIYGVGSAGQIPGKSGVRNALEQGLEKLFRKKAAKAWSEILASGPPVSIKVDSRSPIAATGDDLIIAILESLFDKLIQPWEITVWDRRASDILRRRFELNTRRGAVQVKGAEDSNRRAGETEPKASLAYSPAWLEGAGPSYFTSLLASIPATVIHLPGLKHHPLIGIDCALTGLALGAVNNARRFYSSPETMAKAVSEIWREKPLGAHALTVVDARNIVFHGGPVGLPVWSAKENALIIGSDPVAVDSVALKIVDTRRAAAGLPSCREAGEILLSKAQELGVGNSKPKVITIQVS